MLGNLLPVPTETTRLATTEAPDTADLLRAFLSGRSPQTIKAYALDLEDFASFVGVTDVEEAARTLLGNGHGSANRLALAYRTRLVERGLAPATVNRRLAALRSLVQLARTFGMVPWTLEVQGLRASELVNLDLADHDAQAGTLAVLGKGQAQKTTLTLPAPTQAALQAWLAIRGGHPGPLVGSLDRLSKGKRLLRTSLHRLVHGLGKDAGLNTRPHGLRHAAITAACERAQMQGIGLEQVLDFSRHSRRSVAILMVCRDKLADMQGRLASLVAEAV